MNTFRHCSVLLLFSFVSGLSLVFTMRAVEYSSPFFAIVLTFITLGVTAQARPFSFMKPPASVRQVRSWELSGGVYRALRVPEFGTLLRRTPLRYCNSKVYLSCTEGDPETVCAQMEAAEAAHVWAMFLTIPYITLLAVQNRWSTFFWFVLINVGVNVYPVLHLRWARGRLIRVCDRKRLAHARMSRVAINS